MKFIFVTIIYNENIEKMVNRTLSWVWEGVVLCQFGPLYLSHLIQGRRVLRDIWQISLNFTFFLLSKVIKMWG